MSVDIKEICFPQDTAERKRWFSSASFSHPAKMHLSLQFYLIEHYTKKGDTILDPMTGSGTVLVGCALERNVICVELEEKFVQMQEDNWEKIKSLGPMLGYKMGEAVILQGDARNLNELLVDKCIFSPPYAETTAIQDFEFMAKQAEDYPERLRQGLIKGHARRAKAEKRWLDKTAAGQAESPENISNLPYGEISAVISSPPFGEAHNKKGLGVGDSDRADLRDCSYLKTGTKGQIGDMPYADAVITRPPYEGSLEASTRHTKGGIPGRDSKLGRTGTYADLDPSIKRLREHGRTDDKAGGPYGRSLGHPYSGAADNIGNLKSENYLSAMLLVYQNCHRVLKPEGLMILVVKNFIREKKIVRLDLDTIKLCEQTGFALIERLKRKLTQQSFWRRIYEQKYPDAPKINYEDVLVFKK